MKQTFRTADVSSHHTTDAATAGAAHSARLQRAAPRVARTRPALGLRAPAAVLPAAGVTPASRVRRRPSTTKLRVSAASTGGLVAANRPSVAVDACKAMYPEALVSLPGAPALPRMTESMNNPSDLTSLSALSVTVASTIPGPPMGATRNRAPIGTKRGINLWPVAALAAFIVWSGVLPTSTAAAQLAADSHGKTRRNASVVDETELVAAPELPRAAAPRAHKAAAYRESDVPMLLRAAGAALREGQEDRARELYMIVTSLDPMSSEAYSGLGTLARRHGNLPEAVASFEHALEVNDRYFPAALALTDVAWESGARESAAARYRDIIERFPARLLPSRVLERGGRTH
jgi:hypothetical protein